MDDNFIKLVKLERYLNNELKKLSDRVSNPLYELDLSLGSVTIPSKAADTWTIPLALDIKLKKISDSLDSIVLRKNILKLPYGSAPGYKIDGSFYYLPNTSEQSKGWSYTEQRLSGKKQKVMMFVPKRGKRLYFYYSEDDKSIKVVFGKSENKALPLGVFLNAMYGETKENILDRLKDFSYIVTNSFNYKNNYEDSREDSIRKVAEVLKINTSSMTMDKLFYVIKNSLYGKFVEFGNFRNNFNNFISYSNRLQGQRLYKDLTFESNGKSITLKGGEILSRENLILLDQSDVDCVETLLNNYDVIKNIKYKSDSKVLELDDIYTALNILINDVKGLSIEKSIYSLSERSVKTFYDYAAEIFMDKANDIAEFIEREIQNPEYVCSDLYSINEIFKPDLDVLVNEIKTNKTANGNKSCISEQADNLNIVSVNRGTDKINTGIDADNAKPEALAISTDENGFVDPLDQPEGASVGVNKRMSYGTIIKDGKLLAPFIRVINGQIDPNKEIVYLSTEEAVDKYIADFDADFTKDKIEIMYGKNKKEKIFVKREQVEYVKPYSFSNMSGTVSNMPFAEMTKSKRWVLYSNQMNQCKITINTERPRLSTGSNIMLLSKNIKYGKDILLQYLTENLKIVDDLYIGILSNILDELEDKVYLKLINVVHPSQGIDRLEFDVVNFEDLIETINNNEDLEKIFINDSDYSLYSNLFIEVENFLNITKNSSYSVELNKNVNHSDGNPIYKMSDYVLKPRDVDVIDDSAKIINKTDFGFLNDEINNKILEDENSIFNGENIYDLNSPNKAGLDPRVDFKIGSNFLIGYVTHSSCCMDDAIVMSSDRIADGSTINLTMFCIEAETDPNNVKGKISFGKESVPSNIDYIESTGLPRRGSVINCNEIVIGRKLTYPNGSVEDRSIRLSQVQKGIVCYTEITNDKNNTNKEKAIVYLVSYDITEEGDKYTGDHGNKGVIGKIVPKSDMMYIPETGQSLDVQINPLGVPARMNLSQLVQAVISFALLKEDKYLTISSFNQKEREEILSRCLKRYPPMRLRDGRTNVLTDRPITVGVLYLHKLSHEVTTKYKSVGESYVVEETTGQPKQGVGQAIGEMELHCLNSLNCRNLVQEIQTIASSDHKNKNKIKSYYKQNSKADIDEKSLNEYSNLTNDFSQDDFLEGDNVNSKILRIAFRAYGLELTTNPDGSPCIFPMSEDYIRSLNHCDSEITEKGRLCSREIFGSLNSPINVQKGLDKYGYINFDKPTVNPFFIEKSDIHKFIITKHFSLNKKGDLVSKLEPLTQQFMIRTINNKNFLVNIVETYENGVEIQTIAKSIYDILLSKDKLPSKDSWISGLDAVIKILNVASLDVAELYYKSKISAEKKKSKPNKERLYEFENCLSSLLKLKDSKFEFKNVVLKCYPVIPLNFRDSFNGRMSDLDGPYNELINNKNNPEMLYKHLRSLQIDNGNTDKKNLTKLFFDKEGLMRGSVVKKRVDNSFRSTIIPGDVSNQKCTEIGLPLTIALEVFWSNLITTNQNTLRYFFNIVEEGKDNFNKFCRTLKTVIINKDLYSISKFKNLDCELSPRAIYEHIISLLEDLCKNKVVIAGRQPTLHGFGIRGFDIKLTKNRSLAFHPAVDKGYNADFDGDQMWGYAPIKNETIEEVRAKLFPSRDYITSKDGELILKPNQDFLLGCYIATMLHGNTTNLYFNNCIPNKSNLIFEDALELRKSFESGKIKQNQLITFKFNNNKYFSTVERILYNHSINGFTEEPYVPKPYEFDTEDLSDYKELKFDGYMFNPINFNSIDSLKESIKFRSISLHDLVLYTDEETGYQYLSTAGRILFNTLVPDGFTDKPFENSLNIPNLDLISDDLRELRFDGLVRSSKFSDVGHSFKTISLSDVYNYVIDYARDYMDKYNTNSETIVADFINKVSDFGCYITSSSGISLGIEDFVEHPNLDKFINLSKDFSNKLDEQLELGLITEDSKTKALEKFNNFLVSETKGSLTNFMLRNNNLFIICDSGARGNVDNLNACCGLIGYVKRDSQNFQQPILSNFRRGLSITDASIDSYSARNGFVRQKKDTKNSGDMSRRFNFVMDGCIVTEHDCSKDFTEVNVKYTSEVKRVFDDNNNEIELYSLMDLKIDPEDKHYEKYLKINNGSDIFTDKAIRYLKKESYTSLSLIKDGEPFKINIRFKISPIFRSKFIDKYIEDKSLPNTIIQGKTVSTKETFDYIEKNGIKTLKVRTPFDCETKNGCICSCCSGIDVRTGKFFKVGTPIGLLGSQAISEEATQTAIDSVNSLTGGNKVDFVNIFKTYLNGSTPKGVKISAIANTEGFINISKSSNKYSTVILPNNKSFSIETSLLKVINGEYIHRGDLLTEGFINPDLLETNKPDKEEIQKDIFIKQNLLVDWFYTFFNKDPENESVRTVFFEVLARIQNSLVKVYESNNNDIKAGSIQFYQDVKDIDSIKFTHSRESSKIITSKYSGSLTPILAGNSLAFMSDLIFNSSLNNTKPKSTLAKVTLGSNVLDQDVIKLEEVVQVKSEKSRKSISKLSNLLEVEDIEDLTETPNNENTMNFDNLDFGSLFSSEKEEEETKEEDIDILLNDIEDINLTKQNRFGDEDEIDL